ncbi:hypothetical protein Bpfe_031165 [Biomphalaria pfeifferi]|uniref:Uncharacterized protein n=1 Tax=Biomphalaria pfeifferi TaxID=112525 RepID=A0AAD8AP79_BIOPF|nr:hypothetical protein Bpfe_031165 [Biomphalaria pfeifferi]
MSKITFWCDDVTGLSGSDSPYFLVYAGDAKKSKSVVKRVRKSSWDDNVDAGEPARSATVSFPELTSLDLVMVALLEEDWDPDENLALKVHGWMDNLDNLLPVFQTGTGGNVATIFREEFIKAIKNKSDNDDLVNAHRFVPSTGTKHYFGDGGHYRVKFDF